MAARVQRSSSRAVAAPPSGRAPALARTDGLNDDPSTDLLSAQSPETLAALWQLREKLGEAVPPHVTDLFLLRFLLASKGAAADALNLVVQRLQWERELKVEEIVAAGPLEESEQVQYSYPQGCHGVDRYFRPVIIERPGIVDVRTLMSCSSHDRLVRRFVYESEMLLREKFPACSIHAGRLVHRALNIIDLDGLSFRAVSDAQAKALVVEIVKIQQNKYPEVIGRTVIVNAPRLFSVAWQAIKPSLDARSIARIEIIGQDPHKVKCRLLELVEAKELPKFLGGECCCSHVDGGCLCSNRGPWSEESVFRKCKLVPYYDIVQRFAEGRGADLTVTQPLTRAVEPSQSACDKIAIVEPDMPEIVEVKSNPFLFFAKPREPSLGVNPQALLVGMLRRLPRRPSLPRRLVTTQQQDPSSLAIRTGLACCNNLAQLSDCRAGPESPRVLCGRSEGGAVKCSDTMAASQVLQPTTQDEEEVSRLLEKLESIEQTHMQTLESWMAQSLRWEKEVPLLRIAWAAQSYEAERALRVARQRAEEAETRYREALAEYDDLSHAVSAAKSKLEVLWRTGRDSDRPETPENAHEDACRSLKDLSDRAASAVLQRDSAVTELKREMTELEREKDEHSRFQPYFAAKWAHEEKVLEEIAAMTDMRIKLAEVTKRTGVKVPATHLSLEDFEISSLPVSADSAESIRR